jgi:hypothetical protein
MRTPRIAAVVALSLAAFAFAFGAGCADEVGKGDRPLTGPPYLTTGVYHEFHLPFSAWASGVSVTIRSKAGTKQEVTVKGRAKSKETSPSEVTVSLVDDKNYTSAVAKGDAPDEKTEVDVQGANPTAMIEPGPRVLKLVPGGNTLVAPGTMFTVTITELDPMR